MAYQSPVKTNGLLTISMLSETGLIDSFYDIGAVIPAQDLVLNTVFVRLVGKNQLVTAVPINYTSTNIVGNPNTSSTTTSVAYSTSGTMTTITSSTNQSIVYVEMGFLGAQNLLDGNQNQSRLPVLLSGQEFTLYCPQIKLSAQRDVGRSFRVACYDKDGALFSGIAELVLQFNYGISQNG